MHHHGLQPAHSKLLGLCVYGTSNIDTGSFIAFPTASLTVRGTPLRCGTAARTSPGRRAARGRRARRAHHTCRRQIPSGAAQAQRHAFARSMVHSVPHTFTSDTGTPEGAGRVSCRGSGRRGTPPPHPGGAKPLHTHHSSAAAPALQHLARRPHTHAACKMRGWRRSALGRSCRPCNHKDTQKYTHTRAT